MPDPNETVEARSRRHVDEWLRNGRIPESADTGGLEVLQWRILRECLISDHEDATPRVLAILALTLQEISEHLRDIRDAVESLKDSDDPMIVKVKQPGDF